jgi:hypothetical protein
MATYFANRRIRDTLKRAQQIKQDSDREARIARQLCKACHYFPAIAGQAFTDQPCACCDAMQTYSSTHTDALCMECAKAHELCKHCSGDIDMRSDRQFGIIEKSTKSGQ